MKIFDIYPNIADAPVEIRMCRAKADDTPPDVLVQLSRDPFWFVRDLVACNKNTPIECLQTLMFDSDFRIHEDARKTLVALGFKAGITKFPLDEQITAASERYDHQREINECPLREDLCR